MPCMFIIFKVQVLCVLGSYKSLVRSKSVLCELESEARLNDRAGKLAASRVIGSEQ